MSFWDVNSFSVFPTFLTNLGIYFCAEKFFCREQKNVEGFSPSILWLILLFRRNLSDLMLIRLSYSAFLASISSVMLPLKFIFFRLILLLSIVSLWEDASQFLRGALPWLNTSYQFYKYLSLSRCELRISSLPQPQDDKLSFLYAGSLSGCFFWWCQSK